MVLFALICASSLAVVLEDSAPVADVAAYQAAAARAGSDANAHVRLAAWCEAHGLSTERHKHLARALELDPDNAAAHGLLGQVYDGGEWRQPDTVIAERRNDRQATASLEAYRTRREKIPDTAQAHWQIAEWCEQNGLKSEATAHLVAVVRLNPAHEEAWKKLGFRKQKGRSATAETSGAARAESDAAHRADAKWRPVLQKWKGWLERKAKHAEAEAALKAVHDPRAVPSIWSVFAAGRPADQVWGVRALEGIDAPSASRALASLSVLGSTSEVRNAASIALLRRDPREFAPFLIGLLRDPIDYEVRPVEGPGKPGELYVRGERANTRFFYAAPAPLTTFRPTDIVGFDYDGMPVASRVVGFTFKPVAAVIDPLMQGAPDLTGAPEILGRTALGKAGVALGQQMLANQQNAVRIGIEMEGLPFIGPIGQNLSNAAANANVDRPFGGPMVQVPLTAQVPVGRLMAQAEQQAAASKTQLQEDVAALDRYNHDVRQFNDRVKSALETALLDDHGPDRKAWTKWWTDVAQSWGSASPSLAPNRPQPPSAPTQNRAILPGFAAGTPVWTSTGLQPVESLRTGDLVLTQETATGTIAFTPVLVTHQEAAQPVREIAIGGTTITATELERFWVSGKGWVMALDLKPKDAIRGLGDSASVGSLKESDSRPAYQVCVGVGRGLFVGERGILAHDERVAAPATSLFDSVPELEPARSDRILPKP
jgi:hypothetical protein